MGEDYTPLLGGNPAKALAKRPPHNTDPTLKFYTLRVYTIRRSATFWTSDFWVLLIYLPIFGYTSHGSMHTKLPRNFPLLALLICRRGELHMAM